MTNFRTRIDFTDRQAKQLQKTDISLSGKTSFGIPYSALTSGVDLNNTIITDANSTLLSTFSGNTGTTVYTFGDSRMSDNEFELSTLTPVNSGFTQTTGPNWSGYSPFTTVDGYSGYSVYSAVTYDIDILTMADLGGGAYSGTVTSEFLAYSANSLDFTGRTIWVDVSGITRTKDLIVTNNPVIGHVLTCIDAEGRVEFQPSSGATSGGTDTYTTGTTVSGDTITFYRNDGGIYTATVTGNTGIDTYTTGGTVSGNSIIFSDNSGSGFTVSGTTFWEEDGMGNTALKDIKGIHNIVDNSEYSIIGGGRLNYISGATHASISGGYNNKIYKSHGFIGGGQNNTINNTTSFAPSSYGSAIIGGFGNSNNSLESIILGGLGNLIEEGGSESVIIGGGPNTINDGNRSVIAGGQNNTIDTNTTLGQTNSGIIGGVVNTISGDTTSSLIHGGTGNTLNHTNRCVIIGGENNFIDGVIGGSANTMTNTVIIGGRDITGTTNDMVYVPDLIIDGLTSTDPIATDANGKIVAGVSDRRLKTHISGLISALDKVMALEGVSYEWTEESNMGAGITKYGFIAQEVQKIIPEMVRNRSKGDGMLTLSYTEIIPWLVEAVKELVNNKIISTNNVHIETQTIISEDNNIELNYNGTHDTSLGGGISVLHSVSDDNHSFIKTDENGDWVVSPSLKPTKLIVTKYTPTSTEDNYGEIGETVRDNDYIYIKGDNGWGRTKLENF